MPISGVNANPYAPIVESTQGLATLGDLVDYKAKLDAAKALTAERNSQTAERNQQVADRQRAAGEAARSQATIEAVKQRHIRQDGSLDQTGFLSELSAADPKAFAVIYKQVHEANTALLGEQKAQRDEKSAQSAEIEALTRGIDQDPALAAINLPKIKALRPDIGDYIGDGSDPTKIQHVRQQAMTFQDYQKDLDRIDKEAKTTNDHVLAQIAAATTPQQVQDAFLVAHNLGTDHLLEKFGVRPDAYNPATDKAKVLSLMSGVTADKVAELMAAPKAAGDYTLGQGQKRFNAQNQEVAAVAPRPVAAAAAGGKAASADSELADTVIAEPGLWDQLTPTVKGRIASTLRAKGYEGFGKPMSEAAMKQISESQSAIDSLTDLKDVLKKNEQYIGPVAGLQALNPYSDARKAQANIDLVRQRVGKALEGGVLRKEDEEKYKLILATLRDTPETAIYKVDQLVKNIQNNIENFKHQQRLGGKRVETTAAAPTTGGKKDPLGLGPK